MDCKDRHHHGQYQFKTDDKLLHATFLCIRLSEVDEHADNASQRDTVHSKGTKQQGNHPTF